MRLKRKPDYEAAERHVFNLLGTLNKNLYYHNLDHTKDVIESVERLYRLEKLLRLKKVFEEEILDLKTGALCHDTGFLIRYKENEQAGAGIARGSLGIYGYAKKQIKKIARMIMPTKFPQNPKTLLEKILCDADVDNFGREDFFEKGELMRRELEEQGIKMSDKEWYGNTLKLLEGHSYFTDSAKKLRQERKEENIRKLKELLGMK